MQKIFLPFLFVFAFLTAHTQNDDSWKIFDDTNLGRVDITINPDTLEWIYDNVDSDIDHVATIHFHNGNIDETIDSVGFRLRGNTSRVSAKKSFKISFNSYISGRSFHGIQKLNLNGEHNDPSIIRSKLCFDLYRDMGMTATRANHIKVYINGNYYGLYINVEHVDDEFLWKNFNDDSGNLWKCLYPADLTYLGSNPATYQNLGGDHPAYELKTNTTNPDFTRLVHLIDVVNNTTTTRFQDSLENNIYIADVLRYLAMNVLVGGWDDYRSLMNNYYLYHEPTQGRFHLIPYDYDNTFGVDWFNVSWKDANPYNWPQVANGSRPLAEKMLANNQYRDLYTHFLAFYSVNTCKLSLWEPHMDSLKTMITPAAQEDNYRTLDYGFTMDDFNNSYSSSYQNQHVKTGIREFVNTRNNTIGSQLSYKNAAPIVYNISYTPFTPGNNDSVYVYASAFSHPGLTEVVLHYQVSGVGGSSAVAMEFKPVAGTQKAEEADRWMAVIPPVGGGKTITLTVSVKDNLSQSGSYPRVRPVVIKTAFGGTGEVLINEIMADNTSTIADPAGEYDDWIELYNPGNAPVLLTGKYLTDNLTNLPKWKFEVANLYINAGEHLLVWCDEDQTQTGLHTNFKLSAAGEELAIVDTDGATMIDALTFGAQQTDITWGRYPDGGADWQFMPPTPAGINQATGIPYSGNKAVHLIVSPNPVTTNARISVELPSAGNLHLSMFDQTGKEILLLNNIYQPAGTFVYELHTGALVPGLYLLKATGKDFSVTTRIMKIRSN